MTLIAQCTARQKKRRKHIIKNQPKSKIIQVLAPDVFDVIQNRFLAQAFSNRKDVERERLLETYWIGNITGMGTEDSFKKSLTHGKTNTPNPKVLNMFISCKKSYVEKIETYK